MGELAQSLSQGERIDIAYLIDLNSWNGNEELQLKIKDFKKSNRLGNAFK